MEDFEATLARATNPTSRELLGAIALVVNCDGIIYHHTSGHQFLAPDAPPLDPDSTFMLASAGKFITHIAALQCVERSLITLDESVHHVLPELDNIPVLSRNTGPDAEELPFIMNKPKTNVTLRMLLSHSSGLDYESNPMVQEWRKWRREETKNYHPGRIPGKGYETPFVYEPGEGWIYGASIEWTGALVARLTGMGLGQYVEGHIFEPLGMISSTYCPHDREDVRVRMLRMVQRKGKELVEVSMLAERLGLVSSSTDLGKLFADLLGPESKILSNELRELLFKSQFASGSAAGAAIRKDTENYAVPAGIPTNETEAKVNHSLAALVLEGDVARSGVPKGTVTWNGMPNLIWCMSRESGVAMCWLTQVLPVDDEKTVVLAMEFFTASWRAFG